MNRAWNMIDSISQNDLERETAESLEKARREEATIYHKGYEEGFDYGYTVGQEEARQEIANIMLHDGVSPWDIEFYTKILPPEIE